MLGPEFISGREQFLQEPLKEFNDRFTRVRGAEDKMDFLVKDGISQMLKGIRGAASLQEEKIGSFRRREDVTIFSINWQDAVALVYLVFLKELRNTAKDGKFDTLSVLAQINHASTGTLAEPLEIPSPGIEELSVTEIDSLKSELEEDLSLSSFLSQVGWGVRKKFKPAQDICGKYHIGMQFDTFGRQLSLKMREYFGAKNSQKLLTEGKTEEILPSQSQLLTMGLTEEETRLMSGFRLEQIKAFLQLRNKFS